MYGLTRQGSTAQCRKVRSRQSWAITTGPRNGGAIGETGSVAAAVTPPA
jgi:hypothetical protein